ncbi:hypothetical protein M407DRAFT_9493 [Tulasnella calospora MUT 4182]|uniref:Uncharacterized protein n=1 Tax=Tulasnella calospora MUT 4182 TaxID=1051891 RepID=A0A0C3QEB5_9AGAM|nr:hypothetical protein M407DRAFT_9493 [Tulasnella calospora MUT 4182]
MFTRRPLQVTPGAQLRADQTPPCLEDWTDGRTTDPIWPDYARPQANLPSSTAEAIEARLSRLAQVQSAANTDLMYAVQHRDWSKEIRMSADGVSDGDSPVWMTLIRSRWLVIETLRGHLQLWDIEGAGDTGGVLAPFSTLEGSVDGAVVTDEAGGPVELFISTTEYRTYSFVLDLPHQNQDGMDTYGLAPQRTTLGFSGLKDQKKGRWAFARSEGNTGQGFLSVPHATTPLVRLAAASELEEVRVHLDVRVQGWKT